MTVELILGDCLEVMKGMDDNSIDTIITDPPYGLEFMGKDWDKGVPGIPFWAEMLRIAKPGACLMAMGGTRTYHRLASAIEDAGWRIIDMIEWLYGSGFPKSYDIGKGMDKARGEPQENKSEFTEFSKQTDTTKHIKRYKRCTECGKLLFGQDPCSCAWRNNHGNTPEAQLWNGWGTALKPAHEPICVAYKPREGTYVENALKWGVAGLNIDGGRVGTDEMQINTYSGRGPFGDSQVGNDYDSKVTQGRFPANVIHDGSDEVLRGFPETSKGWGTATDSENSKKTSMFGIGGVNANRYDMGGQSAARFFYCAKASRSERNAGLEGMEGKERADINKMMGNDNGGKSMKTGSGNNRNNRLQNHHPTVKPIALMEYLVRLTKTPTGGVVLDPFMGSGTTGIACVNEGRDFIGIEQNEEYLEIARRRIEYWQKRKQPRLL